MSAIANAPAPADAGAPAVKKRRFWLDNERFVGVIFLMPAVIYIVLLVGFPFALALIFSVTNITVGSDNVTFVGLDNFVAVAQVPTFQRALVNTFMFTLIAQVFIILFANILAILLTQNFPGKWFLRFLIMLPWATPVVLGTIGWLWLLDSAFSPIDWLLREVGLLGTPTAVFGAGSNVVWLGKPDLARFSVILVQVWRMTPLTAVIIMAGLTSISTDILDQAKVDGARFWRTLFQVKLPLVLPIMIISLLFSTVFTIGDMSVVYILTRGGPADYTQVLSTWSYFVGINGGNLGQGAAIAVFLFPVLLAIVIVLLRVARRAEVN